MTGLDAGWPTIGENTPCLAFKDRHQAFGCVVFQALTNGGTMSMQHECNKSESSIQKILRFRFEDIIDEMLEEYEGDPENTVELVEILIAVRAEDAKIELPLPILRDVLHCAKRGMRKRGGRGRPRKSFIEQVVNNIIVNWACERKAQFHASGMKNTGANSAEDKAAEEAREELAKLFGKTYTVPAVGTIKRHMQSAEKSTFFAK
jgi:hypothetical protein